MLENLLEGFKKAYDEHGDEFICLSHRLDDGLYIKIGPDRHLESYVYTKDDFENAVDETYRWFQKRDFISKYLESNKAIPTKPLKRIHSNNYLTWFVKRDTLMESEKTLTASEIIGMTESYYESLVDSKLNQSTVLANLEDDFSEETYEFCKGYMMRHYLDLEEEIIKRKDDFSNYIKVFFDFDFSMYIRESNRYYYHKIFNSDAYNVTIDDTLYGLSNFNMSLNSKKPYLEHKTMRRNAPYMITLESALLGYKYSLYLKNHGYGIRYQPSERKLTGELDKELRDLMESQNLIYLTQDNGLPVVVDYDIISSYDDKLDYKSENHLEVSYKEKSTSEIITKYYEPIKGYSKKSLESDVDQYLFLKQLTRNYFSEGKDIKPSKFINKIQIEHLLQSRALLFDYFYKGMDENLRIFVDKNAFPLVIEALKRSKTAGCDAYNIYFSMKKFCKGEDQVKSIQRYKEELKKMMESETDILFTDVELYSFAAGQLAYYLLSRSGASKKNHDVVESFLNRKNAGQLNEELMYWFKRYAHDIGMSFGKFNRLYAGVLTFDKSAVKQDDIFLAGYLSNNMFYEKKEVLEDE